MLESPVAEVQKPQSQSTVERAPGEPQTVREAWRDFKDRVQVRSDEGATKGQERTDPAKKNGERPEPKQGKEPAAAKGEGDAAAATEGESEGKPAPKTETQQNPQQVAYDRLLERASQEPDFDKVVERLHEPFFPLSREGHARYQVLGYALRECINPDDVLYFLARPENSSVAHNMQNATPDAIAKTVHMISAELRFGKRTTKREEEPRPRPKPPAEVGGRGAHPGDRAEAAARNGNFPAFEEEMNRRARANR